MKILFAVHQFFPEHFAGTEVVTLGLARELRSRGHETFVLASKRSIPASDIQPGEIEDYEFEGVPVRRVGRPREDPVHPRLLDYRNDVMAVRAREYMQEVKPDIVHAIHFQWISVSVISVFKEFGVPLMYTATDFWTFCPVVDLRRHDGVMCEGPELVHCLRCIASRHPASRLRKVVDMMPDAALRGAAALSETPFSRYSDFLRQVGIVNERPGYIREKMELVDRVIAGSRLTRDLLVANGIGGDKIRVSYDGIDTSKIVKAPEKRELPPPLRVGFIGTMASHKGCDLLIRAFRKLPPDLEATLTIHGNLQRFKPNVKQLRRLARGDERITFAGPFQREEVGQVLSEMDVLVVPSRWYENAPLVICEAFAAGIPVVATNLGTMPELVKHEENGLLFKLDNAEHLARQLRRLGEEPGLLEKLRAGIGPVKTVEDNVDELEVLYGELLDEKGQPV
jgi:glycosyltransferase involved in cell wall biosynthesis